MKDLLQKNCVHVGVELGWGVKCKICKKTLHDKQPAGDFSGAGFDNYGGR